MQNSENQGLLASLFDFTFSNFITTKIIRIVYAMAMIFCAIFTCGFIITGFTKGFFTGILFFILSPVIFLLYIMSVRIFLELIIVIFRIAENIEQIKNQNNIKD
jgi:uncharacterized membrane protein